MTLTLEAMALKCHHVGLIINCDNFYQNMSTHFRDMRKNAPQSAFLTLCSLAVTFDLLTSKSNQLSCHPQLHQSCKFGEIPTGSLYHVNKLSDKIMDACTHARTAPKQNAFYTILMVAEVEKVILTSPGTC